MKVSIIAICLCIFYFTASSASPSPQRNDDPCFCQLTNSVICKRRRKEHGCISATTESAFALTGGTTESAIVSSRPPSGGADVVNCEWSTWSSSGTCSESCGGGNQIYVRSHRVKSKNGGQDCDGLFHKTERCNTNSCPRDCKWTNWSTSGSCSKSCGGGNQRYLRTHLVTAQNGGQQCPGTSQKFEKCNTQSCPTSIDNFSGMYTFH